MSARTSYRQTAEHHAQPFVLPPLSPASVWSLRNGLRVVHRAAAGTRLVHVALIFDVGSRDEGPAEQGMAHFIEHMVFKGTTRRRSHQILSRIDAVGGELNAYTTKEKTVFHATVTREHLERAVELLADIAFAATFPAAEVEKEKAVIGDEIELYRDDPEEAIFEDFDRHVFGRHALAHPIVGTKASIGAFSSSALRDFVRRHFGGGRAVLSVVGACAAEQVAELASRHLAHAPKSKRSAARRPPRPHRPSAREITRSIQQTHLILGGRAYGLRDPRQLALQLLNHHLGGPTMNSRLSLHIRERHGLGYNIQSFYTPFVDGGCWGVYASVEPEALARLERLVRRELDELRRAPMSASAFARIRRQYMGSLIIAHEGHFNMMLAQGKDLLDFGRVVELEQVLAQIERLGPADLHRVADECFDPTRLDRLVYRPD